MVTNILLRAGIYSYFLLISLVSYSQSLFPDFDAAFHRSRREAIRQLLPPNSLAVFFTNPIRNRSNDVDFPFHQDTDFFYMTGLREPNAVLLIFSTPQKNENGKTFSEILFLQEKAPEKELWNGKRLGVEEARNVLGIDSVLSNTNFNNITLNFQKFATVYFKPLPEGVVDDLSEEADLYDLIQIFRKKANIPDDFDPALYELYAFIRKNTDRKAVW
ncbi:MAG: aminopeptidase P N-terminal domain-containing protein, partial [Flammeovirgaceae bacterium]|nr:aminopeptidase P N-terminal domain-containing protein [Flammeovirgaceae bacterium]MDW8287475.1 aminopeptidase P N-terminal domain-containing protein [Flammeovirgaceae bacterium]